MLSNGLKSLFNFGLEIAFTKRNSIQLLVTLRMYGIVSARKHSVSGLDAKQKIKGRIKFYCAYFRKEIVDFKLHNPRTKKSPSPAVELQSLIL